MEYIQIKPSMGYPTGGCMEDAIDYAAAIAKAMVPDLAMNTNKPIAVWCRGSSGAILAALLIREIGRGEIKHIKKPGEKAHSEYTWGSTNHYNVIIDDFVGMGDTIDEIYSRVKDSGISVIDCLAVGNVYKLWQNSCDIIQDHKKKEVIKLLISNSTPNSLWSPTTSSTQNQI